MSNRLSGYADFSESEARTGIDGAQVGRMVKPRKRYVADNLEFIRKSDGSSVFPDAGRAAPFIELHPRDFCIRQFRAFRLPSDRQ